MCSCQAEFQSKSEGQRAKRANGVSFSPKASRLETQEELLLHLRMTAGKELMFQFKPVRQEEFPFTLEKVSLFVQFRPSADWRATQFGKAICFT